MRTGFDTELMRSICDDLGFTLRAVPYTGDDFDGIFDGLEDGSYDAVISGTTITPERERVALFSEPYLQFDQGLAVNVGVTHGSNRRAIYAVVAVPE
jgi:polar amino acid transport system substrate-binding protein